MVVRGCKALLQTPRKTTAHLLLVKIAHRILLGPGQSRKVESLLLWDDSFTAAIGVDKMEWRNSITDARVAFPHKLLARVAEQPRHVSMGVSRFGAPSARESSHG